MDEDIIAQLIEENERLRKQLAEENEITDILDERVKNLEYENEMLITNIESFMKSSRTRMRIYWLRLICRCRWTCNIRKLISMTVFYIKHCIPMRMVAIYCMIRQCIWYYFCFLTNIRKS